MLGFFMLLASADARLRAYHCLSKTIRFLRRIFLIRGTRSVVSVKLIRRHRGRPFIPIPVSYCRCSLFQITTATKPKTYPITTVTAMRVIAAKGSNGLMT
jgi:hypothetical protein